MKTNHQRGFKDTRAANSFQRKYVVGGGFEHSELADKIISAVAHVPDTSAVSAKKRTRKNKAGAKKYVRTRVRFHENAETKRRAEMTEVENEI